MLVEGGPSPAFLYGTFFAHANLSAITLIKADMERRESNVSTTDTEASFVTPLATPSQVFQTPSHLDLNEDTPRKSIDNKSGRSETATPTVHRRASVVTQNVQRPPTAILTAPEVEQEPATGLAENTPQKTTDRTYVTEINAPLGTAPENEDGQVSKGTTLGCDSSHTIEKQVSTSEKETVTSIEGEEASAKPEMVVSEFEEVAENDGEDETVYPGGLTLGLITLGLLLATFVVALDNTIIGKWFSICTSLSNG